MHFVFCLLHLVIASGGRIYQCRQALVVIFKTQENSRKCICTLHMHDYSNQYWLHSRMTRRGEAAREDRNAVLLVSWPSRVLRDVQRFYRKNSILFLFTSHWKYKCRWSLRWYLCTLLACCSSTTPLEPPRKQEMKWNCRGHAVKHRPCMTELQFWGRSLSGRSAAACSSRAWTLGATCALSAVLSIFPFFKVESHSFDSTIKYEFSDLPALNLTQAGNNRGILGSKCI